MNLSRATKYHLGQVEETIRVRGITKLQHGLHKIVCVKGTIWCYVRM